MKTAQEAKTVDERVSIVEGYTSFSPTLIAAAPASVAPAVSGYVQTITVFLQQLAAARFDLTKLPPGSFAAVQTAAVGAEQAEMVAFSHQQCHYDLQANSMLTATPPPR